MEEAIKQILDSISSIEHSLKRMDANLQIVIESQRESGQEQAITANKFERMKSDLYKKIESINKTVCSLPCIHNTAKEGV